VPAKFLLTATFWQDARRKLKKQEAAERANEPLNQLLKKY